MTTRTPGDGRPVEERLIDLILRNGLRAGDKLMREAELSEALKVSRNSVREAVRSLEALGIVEVRHPKGTYLCHASTAGLTRGLSFWTRVAERDGIDPVHPIAHAREMMEVNLIEQVVDRHGALDFDDLERSVRGMESAAARGEYAPEVDRRFHEAVFRPLDNWILSYILQSFWEAYAMVRDRVDRSGLSPSANAALHRNILEALRRRDGVLAKAAMVQHFDNSLRYGRQRDGEREFS